MTNIPTLLTINETAARAGLAKHFVRQLCIQDKILNFKAGNKYLINFEKFIEFLETGESNNCTYDISDVETF